MRMIRSIKLRECKKCRCDIWPGADCYPLRLNRFLCFNCGRTVTHDTKLQKLTKWVKSFGEV